MAVVIEKSIGRYQILGVLGQGNMATVYKAHDPHINRTLAIKVLRQERCIDAEYRSRFLREAKAVGTLNHPNIVTIYDVGEVDNTPYIAMEMVEGTPLDKLIKEKKEFSQERIAKLGIQLADALHYAHSRNIIHRDIKPSNIILSDDQRIAKITDFGIARVEEVDITQHTQIGNLLGTPQYMSPEQVMGDKVDARSDLFSLGAILYQLVTGKRAFPASNLATLLFQIATEAPEPANKLCPDMPVSLHRIIMRLLDKERANRYQNGQELITALREVIDELNPRIPTGAATLVRHGFNINGFVLTLSLFIATAIAAAVYHNDAQQKVMDEQMSVHASSLTQFMAETSAEPILAQDWRSLEILVKDFRDKYQLNNIAIASHDSTIKASDLPTRLGQKLNTPSGFSMEITDAGYLFSGPIQFGKQSIGAIQFGVARKTGIASSSTKLAPSLIISLVLLTLATISLFYHSRGAAKQGTAP